MKRIILSVVILFSLLYSVNAQKEKLQASYIYQFTKLIEWAPAYKTGDFVIGVLGSSQISNELDALKGRNVATQVIAIKSFASVSEIDKCNILFIPLSQTKQLTAVNRKMAGKCTLVITEKEGTIKNGPSIAFTEDSGKIQFEINKTSFKEHSLNANARLWVMAKTVYQLNE